MKNFVKQFLNKKGFNVNDDAMTVIESCDNWYSNKTIKGFHERKTVQGTSYELNKLCLWLLTYATTFSITPLFQYLEKEVITDIARRISKTLTYSRTAELQALSMQKLGYSPSKIRSEAMKILRADPDFRKAVARNTMEYKRETKKRIEEITRQALSESEKLIADAGNMSWISDLSVWKAGGKELTDDSFLSQLVAEISEQTKAQMINLTNTTGFKTMSGFESMENLYRRELDKGVIKICSGTFDQSKVMRDIVKDLSKSGLRSIDYASGRSVQLDVGVRLALRTGCHQLSGQMTDINIQKTGENLVRVASHNGSRNKGTGIANHEEWQGKVYYIKSGFDYTEEAKRIGQDKIEDLWEKTGYSADKSKPNNPLGLYGYNCRHKHFVFFEGISTLRPEEPKPSPVVIDGKEYDFYAQTQKMRAMERDIRALKREKEALKALGMDTTEIDVKIKRKTREYGEFCDKCNAPRATTKLRYEGGSSEIKKTKAYKDYENKMQESMKNGIIDLRREKLISGKYSTSNEVIDDISEKELAGVRFSKKIVYNGRIRTQGLTNATISPLGKVTINKMELGKQMTDTRECVIDSMLHEELEARIMLRAKDNKFYTKLFNASEKERHQYIDKVIKRFFDGKGLDYEKTK